MRREEVLECARKCDPSGAADLQVTRLEGGSINENWLVLSESLSRVLRIYPKSRRLRQVQFECSLQRHLQAGGARVAQVLTEPNQWRDSEGASRPVVWLEYLPAQHLTPQEAQQLPPADLRDLLAPIRALSESYPPPFRPAFETRVFSGRFALLRERLERLGLSTLQAALSELFEKLESWEAALALPTSAIHADIHPGNVLKSGEKLWLIDFDDAHVGWRAIDWVLPALEFSLDPSAAQVDEARYAQLLDALSQSEATGDERKAFAQLRLLLELKFAASLAVSGKTFEQNPYLRLLEGRLRSGEL